MGSEPTRCVTVSIAGLHDRPVSVAQCPISVVVSVMRVGILRCLGRATCGIRPVVRSAGSGSATRIPAISRPSTAALRATRASWSAVAAPAETPITVDVVRIVAATRRALPSTTATTTVSAAPSRWPMCSSSLTATRRCLDRFGGTVAAHAARSVAAASASCRGPMTSAVGIPWAAAKAASCGPSVRAFGSVDSESTASEEPPPSRGSEGSVAPRPSWWRALRSCQASAAPGSYSARSSSQSAASDG